MHESCLIYIFNAQSIFNAQYALKSMILRFEDKCETWLMHMCDLTRSYVCDTTHILHMSHVSDASSKPNIVLFYARVTCVTQLVWVAEYSLFYRALLQKRPMILRSLYMICVVSHTWQMHLRHVMSRVWHGSYLVNTQRIAHWRVLRVCDTTYIIYRLFKIIGLFCKRAL